MAMSATKEELEASLARFGTYLKADPGNDLLWLETGELHHRLGQFDQALACFAKVRELVPGSAAAGSAIARVHISQHRFDAAEHELAALAEAGERDPALLHNLGVARFFQDRWQDALPCFEQADAAGLAAPANLGYLARTLHHVGKAEEARAACRRWVAAGESADSLGYLALLEMDLGNRVEALALARRALALDPANQDAALVAGTAAMEDEDAEAAMAHFSQVAARNPDSGRAWQGLGLTQLYGENPAGGIASLEKARQLMPGNSGTIVALGWARLSQQDYAGAEQSFREAIELDRGFAEAHGGLASALVFQLRREEARRAIEVADRLDRDNFGSVYARSILLKLEGQGDQASQLLAGVLERPLPQSGKTLLDYLRTVAARRQPAGKRGPG